MSMAGCNFSPTNLSWQNFNNSNYSESLQQEQYCKIYCLMISSNTVFQSLWGSPRNKSERKFSTKIQQHCESTGAFAKHFENSYYCVCHVCPFVRPSDRLSPQKNQTTDERIYGEIRVIFIDVSLSITHQRMHKLYIMYQSKIYYIKTLKMEHFKCFNVKNFRLIYNI